MTAYTPLRASWGSRLGCEVCSECRTGEQGLKTNWLESVQRTAAWFLGKPVPRLCLFAVLLELPCVSQALISYCSGPLIYPYRTCGAAQGVDVLDTGGY